jgi:PAS domain S-box-containing protein
MKKEFREERTTTNITPGLLKLIRLSENEDLSAGLEQAMEICSQVLQVESVCLYLLDPASPQLKKTAWHESQVEFPDVLPSTDLARFEQPGLWVAGNRVLSELQRFARLNKVDYLATAPLSQEGAILGLLAAGGEGVKPEGARLDVLELLAAILVTELQQHILADNLNKEISQLIGAKLSRDAVFEYMNEGIITLDEKLTVLELNPAAEWMLGYANWEVKGQSYENLLIGSERFLPALQEALLGKQTHDIGKASLNRRNGQAFPVKAKVMPISVSEKIKLIEVFISDISEHEQSKALTQQLEHRAVLGDYTAAFAHDVRNPINNISTGLQLLQAKLSEEDPNQEVINRMQGDCTRLNHLMESFLAFSRPLELKFELIEIEPFLRRILDRWQPRMARENVTSTLHIEEGIPRLQGDPRSLENVFTNLISNALEAMTEVGDTLVVKAEKIRQSTNREMVAISISDNGPGIPADILEHIFEPFVTTRQKGTGLGLAITNQIVTAHKGSIRVNSFPGGTVFSVEIPAENGD